MTIGFGTPNRISLIFTATNSPAMNCPSAFMVAECKGTLIMHNLIKVMNIRSHNDSNRNACYYKILDSNGNKRRLNS